MHSFPFRQAIASAALALAVLSNAQPGWAADRDGAYASQRPDTCRGFMRVHAASERRAESVAIRNWIAGYITAYNRQTPETYDVTGIGDFDQVLRLVERFCKANELADLAAAMETVTAELHPTRHQTQRQAGR